MYIEHMQRRTPDRIRRNYRDALALVHPHICRQRHMPVPNTVSVILDAHSAVLCRRGYNGHICHPRW